MVILGPMLKFRLLWLTFGVLGGGGAANFRSCSDIQTVLILPSDYLKIGFGAAAGPAWTLRQIE